MVGGLGHLAHQVRGEEDGSSFGGQGTHELADPLHALGVEPVDRLVGAAAIALAASVAIQNAMFVGVDAPAYGDPIEEVLAWHAQNRVVVAIAVGLEALNLPLLLLFLTGLHGLVGPAAIARRDQCTPAPPR